MRARRALAGNRSVWLDHAALIGAFLTGVLGGVGLKLVGAGPALVITFPILVLLAYVAICLAGGRLELEPETVGDNCYYLGFLFTLASLATALYQMQSATGAVGSETLVPVVVAGFGIALSSTIAGVFLRILLMQMRPDIVVLDREARRDMQAALRDMRANIGTASREFRAMAIEAAQQAAERQASFEAIGQGHTGGDLVQTLLDIERDRSERDAQLLAAIRGLSAPQVTSPDPTPRTSH